MAIQDLTANLDLKQNLNIYTQCKQFDSLNLILSIFDNSIQANLSNYNIRLVAMKTDNIPLIQEQVGITISTNPSNMVNIEAHEQLTTTSGKTLIELQFIDKISGKKKATFNLVLIVVPSTLQVNATISTATYTLLEELENKLDQASDIFENISEAIDATNDLKTSITNATTSKTNLDSSISTANTTKTNLDSSNTTANTTKTALNTSITNANTSKTALDTSKTNADTLKVALDTSITNANSFVSTHGDIINLDNRVTTNANSITSINTSLSELANNTELVARIIYVATTGNDTTGNGTVGTPYATVTKAISNIKKNIQAQITISLADGIYNEDVNITGFYGGVSGLDTQGILIKSTSGTSTNCIVKSITISGSSAGVKVLNIKLNTTTKSCIAISASTNNMVNGCIITDTATTQSGISAYSGSTVYITGCTISNKLLAIYCSDSRVHSNTNSGSGNTIGLSCGEAGTIGKWSTQPSGTTTESAAGGGIIR